MTNPTKVKMTISVICPKRASRVRLSNGHKLRAGFPHFISLSYECNSLKKKKRHFRVYLTTVQFNRESHSRVVESRALLINHLIIGVPSTQA